MEEVPDPQVPAKASRRTYTAKYKRRDAAYAAHPERFNRRPQAPKLPTRATINDPLKRQQPTELRKHEPSHLT